MDEREFREILAFGHEQHGIEFKRGGSRKNDKRLLAKVIRAAISMANRRDGGRVIIGVEEGDNNSLILNGVSQDDLPSWNHDDLADSIAEYADPSVNFEVESFKLEGKDFVILEVDEFDDFPVICKKNFDNVLRSGACYIRSRRKPETVDIPTFVDMRDLLELAINKGVRNFVRRASSAGLSLSAENIKPSDTELFNKQFEDFIGEEK